MTCVGIRHGRNVAFAAVVLLACATSSYAQQPLGRAPDYRVAVQAFVGADFETLIGNYAALRRRLAIGLPPLLTTDQPANITIAELALARRIRATRGPAAEALFTPPIAAEFRRVLLLLMTPHTLAVIMDDNPGEFSHVINGAYPKSRTVSTMPATLLAVLPELPSDIQYRFLGRILILHDTRANVILDHIVCALECTEDRGVAHGEEDE